MALEIQVSGPGLDVTRRLSQGDPQMVLGRDPECDVCLPDPERTVSRRHLALWAQGRELHFHVVSAVNGIEMAFGEAPPGARGVLPEGQSMQVGDYVVTATPLDDCDPALDSQDAGGPEALGDTDPWAALHASAASARPVPSAHEDDPFGATWGFTTTFGPTDTSSAGALHAPSIEEGGIASFFEGLGVEPGTMSKGELEAMGRLVRLLVLGVLDLHGSVTGVKQELRAEDRTMLAPKDSNNPLKTAWPAETKLRYLFGGRLAAVGFVPAERAMREVLVDLVAHNSASAAAARSAVEGTLRDLAPAAIKTRLLGEGTKLFESTRAWEAYARWHQEQSADMRRWAQRQIDRHFTEAYLRESVRIRRETRKP